MGPYEWITKETLVYRHSYLNPNSAIFDDVTNRDAEFDSHPTIIAPHSKLNAIAHDVRFLAIKFDCVFGIGHLRHGLVAHCAPPWV
jgi:hypothetical protein